MRLDLGNIDANGITLQLPRAKGEPEVIKVRLARALKGTLIQSESSLTLPDAECEWLELDTTAMTFGTTTLTSTGEGSFSELKVSYERNREAMTLELASRAVHLSSLRIEVGSVDVQGELHLQQCQLHIEGSTGRIEAKHARIGSFRMRIGDLWTKAVELVADAMLVGWGPDGFRLEASQLSGPRVSLELNTLRLDAERVALKGVLVHGAQVSFAEAALAKALLELSFKGDKPTDEKRDSVPSAPPVGTVKPKKPTFDWQVLDGLSGSLRVDAVVDMTVPIIGRRRATHKLRLAVEDGSLDYREIESSLSALEDSLLDFAVREGALVLERGIPLLPTRGFGKRLFVWELSPQDLLLAQKRRVRLSVLPTGRLAADLEKASAERDPGSSSFALRRLGLENVDVKLSLDEVSTPIQSAIERLSFEHLSAHGSLQHELTGETREGQLHAQLETLSTAISGLMLGSMRMDVHTLKLESLREATLTFAGLSPSHLRVELAGLLMRKLAFLPESA